MDHAHCTVPSPTGPDTEAISREAVRPNARVQFHRFLQCAFAVLAVFGAGSGYGQYLVPPSQLAALRGFYNSTGGPGWFNQDWTHEPYASACYWGGVQCVAGQPGPNGFEYNIWALRVEYNNLSGTLPDLSGLPFLEQLQLWSNPQLTGAINLNVLTKLTHFVGGATTSPAHSRT